MNPTKISRTTSRYESGLLSAGEVANSLLYDLLSEPELDTAFLSSMDSLPEGVSREFRCLLDRIEKDDFRWTPFLLTSPPIPADPSAYSAKLRRVCALLGQESHRGQILDHVQFETAQKKFAQRLRRLIELPNAVKGQEIDVDAVAAIIETLTDGTENTTGIIVTKIPAQERRLRKVMAAQNHILTDIPSRALFGEPISSDAQRVGRYELIAAILVQSGFPVELLDDATRFERRRFAPKSSFFRSRDIADLNEQSIACWARRLLCFYGEIPNVRVVNKELRDDLATGNRGMTTEDLLEKNPGSTAARALTV